MSRILIIAPHPDDETLGMGGTIAKLCDEGHEVTVALMTGAGEGGRHPLFPREAFETVRAEFRRAMGVLGVERAILKDLPTVQVHEEPTHAVNAVTRAVIEEVRPDRLYLPFPYDLHRDHRELFYSFSVHARAYLPLGRSISEVYAYETPSETHLSAPYLEPAFTPNVYVDISATIGRKVEALSCYDSQSQPAPLPRSEQAIRALAALRGSQIGAEAAEGFVLIRRIVD
ncbi:PIG-L deacetylase family protein [Parvularcula oceani]|uniref:PIG-L deacetylase family protein n=1 Tax=Parvularcula oceani TaxID=1247963 RepID=UPI0004E1B646|nr:PIG-L deacetylase family protein [Parvularcula oceani]